MQLKQLAESLVTYRLISEDSPVITGIAFDSRQVRPGYLFICVKGFVSDGHDYADAAVRNGAVALVVERALDVAVPQIVVSDARNAMAALACKFYGYPSESMKVIGITGTNGKTTSTYIVDHILSGQGYRTGIMGTIRNKFGDYAEEADRTTQEAPDLQRQLQRMKEAGVDYCMMEVSSHALELNRVKGIRFRTGLFTNLTQDHLDYHGSMENYKAAKGLLFARMDNGYGEDSSRRQFAVLNADDAAHDAYKKATSAHVITYGIDNAADVRATNIRITARGTEFQVRTFAGDANIRMKLVGKFNVYNALGAIAATLAEGVPLDAIRERLETLDSVDGRMEIVDGSGDFLVLVDYAHTPDGLENALSTVREFAEGRVISVFGCGGDRDRTKRPIMGAVAAKYSDYVYVTSDNPRTEDPEAILQDIVPGIREAGLSEDRYELIPDRRAAIQKAIAGAGPKDVVLIAGKGHETYQIIGKEKHDFDDRIIAKEALRSGGQ